MNLLDALELDSEINGLVVFEEVDGKKEKVVKVIGLLNEDLTFPIKRKLRKIDILLKEEKIFHEDEKKKIIDKYKNTDTGDLDPDQEIMAQKEYEELLNTELDLNIVKIKAEELSFRSKNSYPYTDKFLIED